MSAVFLFQLVEDHLTIFFFFFSGNRLLPTALEGPELLLNRMNGINGFLTALFVIALHIMFVCCVWPSLHLHLHYCPLHLCTTTFLPIWHSNWLLCPLFHSVAEGVAEVVEEPLLFLFLLMSTILLLHLYLLPPIITIIFLHIWHNSWLPCLLWVEAMV
jgi:hypothetical protein